MVWCMYQERCVCICHCSLVMAAGLMSCQPVAECVVRTCSPPRGLARHLIGCLASCASAAEASVLQHKKGTPSSRPSLDTLKAHQTDTHTALQPKAACQVCHKQHNGRPSHTRNTLRNTLKRSFSKRYNVFSTHTTAQQRIARCRLCLLHNTQLLLVCVSSA